MFLYDDLFEEYIKNIQTDSTGLTCFLLQNVDNAALKTNFINYINTTNIPSELNKFDLFLDDLNIHIHPTPLAISTLKIKSIFSTFEVSSYHNSKSITHIEYKNDLFWCSSGDLYVLPNMNYYKKNDSYLLESLNSIIMKKMESKIDNIKIAERNIEFLSFLFDSMTVQDHKVVLETITKSISLSFEDFYNKLVEISTLQHLKTDSFLFPHYLLEEFKKNHKVKTNSFAKNS